MKQGDVLQEGNKLYLMTDMDNYAVCIRTGYMIEN